MSIFLLPKELCKDMNKLMQKFMWGHRENDHKIHWMSHLVRWKADLIWTIFTEEEVEIVCNLPISCYWMEDKLMWHATSTGEFTVGSAYHLEKEKHDAMQGEGSNQGGAQEIWKIIWTLKIPNSAKVFFWRVCHNILPTKANL
jgi:hypothetical protein